MEVHIITSSSTSHYNIQCFQKWPIHLQTVYLVFFAMSEPNRFLKYFDFIHDSGFERVHSSRDSPIKSMNERSFLINPVKLVFYEVSQWWQLYVSILIFKINILIVDADFFSSLIRILISFEKIKLLLLWCFIGYEFDAADQETSLFHRHYRTISSGMYSLKSRIMNETNIFRYD